jgi:hypothetical protein
MSAAHHNSYAPGFPPSSARVEPPADCASARAGGHLAPGACAPAAPGVLSGKPVAFDHPNRFTAQEIAKITALRAEGASMAQVSEATGRTLRSLENAVSRGTIPRFRKYQWTAEAMAKILAMRDAGIKIEAIAAHFGITRRTAWERIRIADGKVRERRAHNKPRVSMEPEREAGPQAKERRCLCGCNRMFSSTGPGNRIRPECAEVFNNRHTGAV